MNFGVLVSADAHVEHPSRAVLPGMLQALRAGLSLLRRLVAPQG